MADSTHPVTVGLDLGDRNTFAVELDRERQIAGRWKIKTTPAAFVECFAERDCVRVILEAGTHSRWISALLEELGHDVKVVDPRRLPRNHREDKSDWKDAEHLGRVGQAMPELFHEVHHRSNTAHADLLVLKVRSLLVELRTKLVNTLRMHVKGIGKRLPKCDARAFHKRMRDAVPTALKRSSDPILRILEVLAKEIAKLDKEIDELAETRYPETGVLTQVTGVGNQTALAFMLTIGDKTRFATSRTVGSYFGLRPRLSESCSIEPQLRITKAGDPFVRRLLVTAAHYIIGPLCRTDSSLRRWAMGYCERGGKNAKKRAAVAVARKLSVLLHRLWVTGEVYEPLRACTAEPVTTT